ncbi:hypothetical protein L1987_87830 [Smallanthus sonchifolius]|nr:hypothetical protein L1987_87830 [Smallanthus sonchifolius]
MAFIEMLRRRNYHIRDHVAAIRERDPQKCWALQSIVDYNNFIRLPESIRESITGSKFERQRKEKEAESKKRAGKANTINSDLSSDDEEYPDDMTLAEFMRKYRALKVKKNKKKQKAEERRLCAAKPPPAGSCGGLGGFEPCGSVSTEHEPVVGVGGAKGKQKAIEFEETGPCVAKRWPAGSYGRLKPWSPEFLACLKNMNPSEFSTQNAKKFMRRVLS